MLCDMCGSEGKLFKAIVEGAEFNVCNECSKFGKVVGVVKQEEQKGIEKRPKEPEKGIMQIITQNYAKKIREKREQLDLTQKEFAKKINEKESLVQKIESGNFEPSMVIAKKIERFLKVKLIEELEEDHVGIKHTKTEALTIGDLIKSKGK